MDWKLILAGIAIVLLALKEIDHEIRLEELEEMILRDEEEDKWEL